MHCVPRSRRVLHFGHVSFLVFGHLVCMSAIYCILFGSLCLYWYWENVECGSLNVYCILDSVTHVLVCGRLPMTVYVVAQ